MPLVPLTFRDLTISRQAAFFGHHIGASRAETWCRFCPNLNIPQYREPLSEEKKTQLDNRTAKLLRRAISNRAYPYSEFCWEDSAWPDIFSLIMDDEELRVLVELLSLHDLNIVVKLTDT